MPRKPKTPEPLELDDIDSMFDGVTKDEIAIGVVVEPTPQPAAVTVNAPPAKISLDAPGVAAFNFDAGYATALADASNLVGKVEKTLRSGGALHLAELRALRKAIDGLRPGP